ncbi:MAG: PKD domain-containing protein [Pirellulales bacterium]|nr:PKD domain-containing protein [Pirellulales bacterium]
MGTDPARIHNCIPAGRSLAILLVGLVAVLCLRASTGVGEETFRAAGAEFNAAREVVLADDAPPVVVVEFLHHGQIAADGRNVAVAAKNREPAPVRVLQVGPGDFCRLAFETIPRQTRYTIFYGGEPPDAKRLPPWTNGDGLLLETRHYVPCNLRRFEEVRRAFELAKPLAAGYVPTIRHASNPFVLASGPFMSRYHGRLHVEKHGRYTFWTSSQDCSFLLVDGKVVVEAPGRHGPQYQARPGTGKTILLTVGPHEFDYYHVATGVNAMMLAAWIAGEPDKTTRPVTIPIDAFRPDSIGRAAAGPPSTRKTRLLPEFSYTVAGDVPLPDRPRPLVGVAFRDQSPRNLAHGTTVRWDFGDGQTSDQPDPTHVFLKPGIYRVTLSRHRGSKSSDISNQIEVDRPPRTWMSREKTPSLDDYLPIVETYDPRMLDVDSLSQLVAAYLWKAEQIAADLDRQQPAADKPEKSGNKKPRTPGPKRSGGQAHWWTTAKSTSQAAATPEMVRKYQERAVQAVRAALAEPDKTPSDAALLDLARTVAPVARFDLGDSAAAMDLWNAAAARTTDPRRRAECLLAAADVAVNDLLDARRARALVDGAAKNLAGADGAPASRLQRILGDCSAAGGDGPAAREAYAKAAQLLPSGRNPAEAAAHRGARSRSTEEFLRAGQWARAAREIDRWQDEFPADPVDGYLSLLLARCWTGRERHAQAVAVAERLVAVNPDSPYADRLLYLAAAAESKQGHPERASALLNQLLQNYPGSPLVSEVKRRLRKHE